MRTDLELVQFIDERVKQWDPVSHEALQDFLPTLVKLIKQCVDGVVEQRLDAGLMQRLNELQERVEEIERSGIKYMGVWQRAAGYQKGMVVTHRGSAWIALGGVEGARPGEADCWQMMVKAGRDAAGSHAS